MLFYGPVPVMVMSKLKFVMPVAVAEIVRVMMVCTALFAGSE